MASVFLRKYELVITRSEDEGHKTITGDLLTPQFIANPSNEEDPWGVRSNKLLSGTGETSRIDFRTEYERFIKIENLQIKADIKYSSNKGSDSSQQSTISIYNLSKQSKNEIKAGYSVILRAGYETDEFLPVILVAQIISVFTTKQGGDLITEIVCADGVLGVKNIRGCFQFDRDVTYRTVIEALMGYLSDKGIPTGELLEANSEFTLPVALQNVFSGTNPLISTIPSGLNVEGNIMEELKRVCSMINFRAYIVLGKLYVESIIDPKRIGVVEIVQENVIGSIQHLSSSSAKSTQSTENGLGLIIKTFLNGEIAASKGVLINYGEHIGNYKITKVTHKLDYEGGNWNSIIECLPVGT